MLSISNPQKAAQAENYYTQENYYQKNSEIGHFYGKALAAVGLENGQIVDEENYKNLLYGFNPSDGSKMTKNSGKDDRRAGIDLTFSAPKSMSVLLELAEANGDKNLADALRVIHDEAVRSAMQKVEDSYTLTRVQDDDGNIVSVKADGMMYAAFQHDTSRSLDPQLHTHNFIFSQTMFDGRFVAISNEELFRNKMYLGQYYRSELAAKLRSMGYGVELTDTKQGLFEIQGIDQELMEEFSQRSRQIRELEDEYRQRYPKVSQAEIRAYITKDSRHAKLEVNRDDVTAQNKERADALGYNKEWLEQFKTTSAAKQLTPQQIKAKAVQYIANTLAALTEQESTFSREDVLKQALKFGLAEGVTERDLEAALPLSQAVQIDANVYTTQEMITKEREIIEKIQGSIGQIEAYMNEAQATKYLNQYETITPGQRAMAEMVLTGRDRYMAVQGDAGTGKTFSMTKIKEILQAHYGGESKVELIGLSYTGKAAEGLEDETGIVSHTLHSFLGKEQVIPDRQRVYIVDEAGMAGSKQIHELMRRAEIEDARIMFVGDTKQFASISAGNIFADMQRYGIATAYMGEVMRQKTEITKTIVRLIKDKQSDQAIDIMKKAEIFHELDRDEQIAAIVDNFMENQNVLILASRNADRKELNHLIRNRISTTEPDYDLEILESKNVQAADAFFAQSYAPGDYIVANTSVKGLMRGTKARVEVVNKDDNTLSLVYERNGKQYRTVFDVAENGAAITSFTETTRPFRVGERIIFTRNSNANPPVKNGVRGEIVALDADGNIAVLTDAGKVLKFDVSDYNYFDHGYAITDYKSQGMTADDVIVMADATMAQSNSFYVQATRAKFSLRVYTQDADLLAANIQQTQTNTSTLHFTKGLYYDNADRKSVALQAGEHGKTAAQHSEQPDRKPKTAFGDIPGISHAFRAIREWIGKRGYQIAQRDKRKARQQAMNNPYYVKELNNMIKLDYKEIKAKLDPQRVIDHLAANKADFEAKAFKPLFDEAKGEFRIAYKRRSYSVVDFLVKEQGHSFKDANAVLDTCYKAQRKEQIGENIQVWDNYATKQVNQQRQDYRAAINEAKKDNIALYAAEYGYAIDRSRSSRNYIAMKHEESGDRIVVHRNGERYIYFNPQNDTDRGDLYNFFANRGVKGYRDIAAQIEKADRSKLENLPVLTEAKESYDSQILYKTYVAMPSYRDTTNGYLQGRGISKEITDQYSNLKVDKRNNVVTPMYRHSEKVLFAFAGYNQKLARPIEKGKDGTKLDKPIKDLNRGNRSITVLKTDNAAKQPDRIVVGESFVDGLSYIQIQQHDPNRSLLISTNGQTDEQSIRMIKDLHDKYPKAEVVLAFDNDKAGRMFAVQVKAQIPKATENYPENKDWNDQLRHLQQEQGAKEELTRHKNESEQEPSGPYLHR